MTEAEAYEADQRAYGLFRAAKNNDRERFVALSRDPVTDESWAEALRIVNLKA